VITVARLAARTLLFLAGLSLLTALTLFVVAGWLLSWPYRRRSPRAAQLNAALEVAASLAALAAVLRRTAPTPRAGP
jgi:hypothetical protein